MISRILVCLAALTLSLSVYSAPNSYHQPQCRSQRITATYEDLTTTPGVGTVQSVGTYDGLTYNAFVKQQTGDTVPAIKPHSGTKFVSTGPVQQTTSMSTPSIAVANSKDTFNLDNFYFGCQLLQFATACTITIRGYDSNGNQKAVQEFSFTPTGQIGGSGSPQQSASPTQVYCKPSFTDLAKVEFTSDGTGKTIVLDDLTYDLKSC